MQQHYLLASHGSPGSIAAEQAAIQVCQAGDRLDHLFVIPSWWKNMTGDDWLNNGVTRNRFRNYLSEQLWLDSQQVIQRVQSLCKQHDVVYRSLLEIGQSDKSLEQATKRLDYAKVFVGSRRPKNKQGLCDTMLTARIEKQFARQLHIVSYPDE